jgi:hypothetical protein
MSERKIYRTAAVAALLLCVNGTPASAQRSSQRLREVAEMADAILARLMPPEQTVSSVAAVHRGVAFDQQRTVAAFSQAWQDLPAHTAPALRREVSEGSRGLLADCPSVGYGRCALLGWRIYFSVSPVSLGDSVATVSATFLWPERGRVPFAAGLTPGGRGHLVGFGSLVELRRSSRGAWEVKRIVSTKVW